MSQYRSEGQETKSDRQPPHEQKRGLTRRRLLRNEGGATAVEFAFIGIGFIYFMAGTIEFSMAMTVGNSLEAATNLSSGRGKTGYIDAGAEAQEATIRDEIERRVGPMIDMNKLVITNEVYNDFTSLNSPDILEDKNDDGDTADPGEWTDIDRDGFRDGCEGVGGSGSIVLYRIVYPWEIMTPMIGGTIGDGGVVHLMAYSVVKNEPDCGPWPC